MDLIFLNTYIASEDGSGIIQIVIIIAFILFSIIGSVKSAKKADEKRKRGVQKKDVSKRSFYYTKEEKERAVQQKAVKVAEIEDDFDDDDSPRIAPQFNKGQSKIDDYKFSDSTFQATKVENIKNVQLSSPRQVKSKFETEKYEFSNFDDTDDYKDSYDSDYDDEEASSFRDEERIFAGNISDEQARKTSKLIYELPTGKPEDLVQAVIYGEIFGKCLTMRKPYNIGDDDTFESSTLI